MGAIDIFHWCLHVVVFVQLVTCGLRCMHKEEGAKVFTLASIKEKHCVFIHQPLFEGAIEKEVTFDHLKEWKPTKKDPPIQCPDASLPAKMVGGQSKCMRWT